MFDSFTLDDYPDREFQTKALECQYNFYGLERFSCYFFSDFPSSVNFTIQFYRFYVLQMVREHIGIIALYGWEICGFGVFHFVAMKIVVV